MYFFCEYTTKMLPRKVDCQDGINSGMIKFIYLILLNLTHENHIENLLVLPYFGWVLFLFYSLLFILFGLTTI